MFFIIINYNQIYKIIFIYFPNFSDSENFNDINYKKLKWFKMGIFITTLLDRL